MLASMAKPLTGLRWLSVLFPLALACGGESRTEPASTALECSDVRDAALAILTEAEADAPRECRSASDCRLFTGNTKCTHGCGWVVATTDEEPLRDAVEEENALCRDECRQPSPPCLPMQNVADCVAGTCVVLDELHRDDCDVVRSKSVTLLSAAAASAPLECDSASDCVLFTRRPRCVYDCGFSAATTDEAHLEAALADVDELCRDECVQPASSCPPSGSRLVVNCVEGSCVLETPSD